MGSRAARIGVAIFFAGLLAFPIVNRYVGADGRNDSGRLNAAEAIERHGLFLEEVSSEVGIAFSHQAPRLDPKLAHIMPQVASMGAAVSVVDFDRDGWQDLYVTNSRIGTHNALYRNRGDGSFEDVAADLDVADVNSEGTGVSMGSVWGDFDNDGYEDLFLCKWGRIELYRNEAGAGFARVTEKAGLPKWANVNAAIWLDYNRDGNLDLFFGGYYPEEYDLWNLPHTRIMPESFEYAQNGGRKYLYRGNGDGTFVDVTEEVGLGGRHWMMAVSAADLRGTGYPDLFIANDYSVDEVFFNENGEKFVSAGEAAQVGFAPKSGMNVAFGDVMNQGEYAIYVTNISEPGILVQGNNMWVPQPGTSGNDLKYTNMASTLKIDMGGWSYGAQFGDLNNDGLLDLFMTNGYVSADRKESYWYDFSKVAGGHKGIISDARHWPSMEGRSLSGYQSKKLWLNSGSWRFQQVAQSVGVIETYDGRAVALADLWNRGVLDIVVAHQRGPLLVYKNTAAPENHWIAFELEGRSSNRSAIGARVNVFWNGARQVQHVSGGSGFSAQNQRPLHFGLGIDARVDSVVVQWPSGRETIVDTPAVNVLHKLTEPA